MVTLIKAPARMRGVSAYKSWSAKTVVIGPRTGNAGIIIATYEARTGPLVVWDRSMPL